MQKPSRFIRQELPPAHPSFQQDIIGMAPRDQVLVDPQNGFSSCWKTLLPREELKSLPGMKKNVLEMVKILRMKTQSMRTSTRAKVMNHQENPVSLQKMPLELSASTTYGGTLSLGNCSSRTSFL